MYYFEKRYVDICSMKMVLIPSIEILLIHEFFENFHDFCQ